MNTFKADQGMKWIREGFEIFRRRPFVLTNFLMLYFIGFIFLGALPFIGGILAYVITPIFSVFYLQVIHSVNENNLLETQSLFSVFDRKVIIRLLILGGIYFICTAAGFYFALSIDDGTFKEMLSGKPYDMEMLAKSNVTSTSLIILLSHLGVWLLFWFVSPLLAWKKIPFGQALFYSFFSLLRTWKAFLVYLLSLFILLMVLAFFNQILLLLLGPFGVVISFSLLVILIVLMYCSFYCMYISVFGKPDLLKVSPASFDN